MFLSKISQLLRSTSRVRCKPEFAQNLNYSLSSSTTDESAAKSADSANEISSSKPSTPVASTTSTENKTFQNASPTEQGTPDKLYKKLEIEVRGHDPAVLKSYGEFAVMAADLLGIPRVRNTAPRKAHHDRHTTLKSAHVHKKHMVHYEFRTYFRFLDFEKLTGSTADTFLEYVQRNLPEGVSMKVTKVEIEKIPATLSPEAQT